jgi:hypothetical protein
MIVARFEFKPEHASSFVIDGSPDRNVTEVMFESVESLIETMKEFEDYLVDCLAIVNGKVLSLSSFKIR